ncbi:MAG: ATP-dependent RecD-like DNA helicase [Lachnospiraceae bacterium]|nr:ATP-dependent RecD-like DNA helicase [Lachnospiraceae bacterium]
MTIRATVDHIIYQSKESGYAVLDMTEDELVCVGNLSMAEAGETLELTGEFVFHANYGKQFSVTSWEVVEPEDEEAMERYLGSGAVKGLGPVLAKKIVERFQSDAFRIIEEEPERLAEIKGISERKALEIADQVNRKKDLRRAMIFLQKYGISMNMAAKIFGFYGQETYEVVQTNPYRLAEDISGIGFLLADDIAKKAGINIDSDFRVRAGILHVLKSAALEGHTCLHDEECILRSRELLQTEESLVDKGRMDLLMERKLIRRGNGAEARVWLSGYFHMELHAAAMLKKLDLNFDAPNPVLETELDQIERELSMKLAQNQREALKKAARHGVFLLTGGPGTGKTTTINAIIRYFDRQKKTIFLAAPTGRAAKRMTEMTGFPARTIHRLLEVNVGVEEGTGEYFERNEDNPLEADAIIVDEMSMVDITLFNALLKAVPAGTRLILSGDCDQLPSVGPGTVLKDLMKSGCFSMTRLDTIFRQEEGSDIVLNAHAINHGREVVLDNRSRDFFFLKRYDADRIISVVIQLLRDKLPGYVDATTQEIQVLTPTRKGLLGVGRLNTILQEYLNPKSEKKRELLVGDRIFRVGDKVMQNKNNYKREWEIKSKYNITTESGTGVFNGDLGVVKDIDPFTMDVTVEFDEGRLSSYEEKELEELELAYALTIHKSQGSEYPAVVIPLMAGPRLLMNRNLLYTAVTRARKCVVLVGDEKVFYEMKENTTEQKRYTGLYDRLMELYAEEGRDL